VLALIFGHDLWVRIDASASSESDEWRHGFYAQNAVIKGGACLHYQWRSLLPLHTWSDAKVKASDAQFNEE
jgi:hypothetical protein